MGFITSITITNTYQVTLLLHEDDDNAVMPGGRLIDSFRSSVVSSSYVTEKEH
ncbi:hypothetical protein ACE38W_02100 [Chitinophaga sp. Hz27]|uniref:hypothetical protein n=1 Tax=Chitinophaga sp. Hz27 TaxID=3347169 RepID=UPI0035DE4F28